MLLQWWPIVFDVGQTLYQHLLNVSCLLGARPGIKSIKPIVSRRLIYRDAALLYYRANVYSVGPVLNQCWAVTLYYRDPLPRRGSISRHDTPPPSPPSTDPSQSNTV